MRSTSFIRAVGLGVVTLTTSVVAQNDSAIAANLEHYYSYGRSPPVYPTPQGSGTGDWADAYSKAKALVSRMTNDEKNNITYGYASTTNGCSGNSGGVPRLGFPGMCLSDAGAGVRGVDGTNGYPGGVSTGASWNKSLAYARGQYMGMEFKAKGVNVALGPVVGPLGRVAEGGRNWEGFANDPYLAGSLTYDTIQAMQESVIACVKHYITNEQETNRNPPLLLPGALNVSVSSNLDDRTMHETYLWPFQDAIKAGAGSVMCVYNQINGSYGCQNSKTLNGLLKGELGFQGFVVTDWGAQHSGLASAEAGLDMVMPSSAYWENGNLTKMVTNGSLAQSRLDDMAHRIVASWYKYAEFSNPGFGMPISLLAPHEFVDARNPDSAGTILQGAIEGSVLVKNTNGALPISKPKFLSIFGYDAVVAQVNTYEPPDAPTALFSKWSFGLEDTIWIPGVGYFNDTYLGKLFLSSEPWNAPVPKAALNGTMITGGGSGATTPAYIDAPLDAFQRQARIDGTWLEWDTYNQNPSVNGASDACIVFVNELASEGWDRDGLADPYSDTLIMNVASQCNNTHVVIHNAGIRLVDKWIDNPNITSVIFAHLPGQDSGEALVELMYGKQSPSGRLPYTVAKKATDYGRLLHPTVPDNTSQWHTQSNFTEGVFIDYKHFIRYGITPRYAFGYGLTYSNFSYSGLQTQVLGSSGNGSPGSYGGGGNQTVPEGGAASLWDIVAKVTATVTNTGSVGAAEVAQLYVGIPGAPAKQLRGFSKDFLAPGASCTVTFELTRRDLSSWDAVSQAWVMKKGTYKLFVGKSVLDIQLKGSISM